MYVCNQNINISEAKKIIWNQIIKKIILLFLNSDKYFMVHNTKSLKHHTKSSLEVCDIELNIYTTDCGVICKLPICL